MKNQVNDKIKCVKIKEEEEEEEEYGYIKI